MAGGQDFTANLSLPYLISNQAQKHVTLNESLRAIDGLVQASILSRLEADPPISPSEGDRYLVATSATGDWAGQEGNLALYADGGWLFYTPQTGWRVWVKDEALFLVFDGSSWRDTVPDKLQNLTRLGLNATADASNPFLAQLNALLFNALYTGSGGTGDLRAKLNKEASGNVLSLLFQSNYSTRAEVGLVGDDDFLFKVSPDGSVFYEGLRIDKNTGQISFPSGFSAVERLQLRERLGLADPNVVLRNHVTGASWLSSTSAADNIWIGMCWSPELGIFVATSTSGTGNRVMTSPDGENWTIRTTPADNAWRSVCWSPELGIFVAVAASGTGNRVMTSPDGINWTARTSAADNGWYSVCWSPDRSLFVAVAAIGSTGDRVMTSPDGISWTIRTSAADNAWRDVKWAAELGLFVAVASSGTGDRVMTSSDGINWTARTSAADNNWTALCWSPELSLFVAIADSGTGNRVMTSSNGINWTIRTSAADNSWAGVTWSPELGLFVAVSYSGTGNRVMTSSDGITWATRTSAADNGWQGVVWSPQLGLFGAVGYGPGSGDRAMTSVSTYSYTYRG